MIKDYYIYIMASDSGTLYVGVTNNLERRISEHKAGKSICFTSRYKCHKLVYFENGGDIFGAIRREKQIKHLSRADKEKLIGSINETWKDMSFEWF